MKTFIVLITLLLNLSLTAFAAGSANNHSVEKYLSNIQDRVRQCSVMPFAVDRNQNRVEHALRSHCPEVKLVHLQDAKPAAKINVAGQRFIARLIETEFSDGDFYDVEIINLYTQENYRIYNVLAFGDVLLGVLGGETKGVTSTLLRE
jgi:hypothetical protein